MTSLESAAIHVQTSLVNPADPKYCARYYLYFAHSLSVSGEDSSPIAAHSPRSFQRSPDVSVSCVAENHPQTLQAFMNLIRHVRPREAMNALAQKMGTCSCDRQDAYVDEAHDWHWLDHNKAPGRYADPYHPRTDTLECLMRVLGTVLGLQIELYFMHGGEAASWPRNETDIFGSDPRGSVIQCCRWLDEYPSFQLVHLLASFAEDELVISTLLHSATLPKNIVYLLNYACDILPPHPHRGMQLGFGPYNLPITLMTAFIRCLSSITDGVSSAYFYEDQAEPMLDALTRVGREIQDRSPGRDIMWAAELRAHGGAIHEKLALPYDTVRYHPDIVEGSQATRPGMIELRNEKPFATAQNLLYTVNKLMTAGCSNPDCTAGESADVVVGWQQCGGCRRVRYCSQSCQAHEWKHARKPHKAVCPKLKKLGEVAHFPGVAGGGTLPPPVGDAAFKSGCIEAGLDAASLRKINRVLMQDNRIMKILHRDFSLHYEYRLS